MSLLDELLTELEKSELYYATEFTTDDIYDGLELSSYILDGFEIETGASKMVIIPENENWVIKIPFSGYYTEDGYYNEFIEAGCGSEWDYCCTEACHYNTAKEFHLEKCFAKTEKIGEIHGYPVYKQEKAIVIGSCPYNIDASSAESLKEFKSSSKSHWLENINEYWLSLFLECYGEKMLEEFFEFLDNNNIGDLHDDNLGMINGRPVVIDYSDFND